MNLKERRSFAEYKSDGPNWITLAGGEYYPDILKDACELYTPVLVMFGQLLKMSESSDRLLIHISEIPNQWMRIQLCRVFRKYVSPRTPVEMLKKKTKAREICADFGEYFRPVQEVQAAYTNRPVSDEALCAVLWEYKDRGKKGYDLTEKFFDLFDAHFPNLHIQGPKRAGSDVRLGTIFKDYPNAQRPVDFVIYDENKKNVLAIGLARYDSDRGGAQEDDRTGGYQSCVDEIINYGQEHNLGTKIILLNDGPGLLLGSMWDDYSALEERWPGKVLVVTLRMVPERVTTDWFFGE